MRRFGFSLGLAALFFCFVQTAKAEETSIFVKNIEGAGENRQKALADAFQNAVRKAVGTYTLSSSYDDGDTLDEKIFLNADAVVKSHNVVASEATPDGFMIVIDAEIVRNEMMKYIQKTASTEVGEGELANLLAKRNAVNSAVKSLELLFMNWRENVYRSEKYGDLSIADNDDVSGDVVHISIPFILTFNWQAYGVFLSKVRNVLSRIAIDKTSGVWDSVWKQGHRDRLDEKIDAFYVKAGLATKDQYGRVERQNSSNYGGVMILSHSDNGLVKYELYIVPQQIKKAFENLLEPKAELRFALTSKGGGTMASRAIAGEIRSFGWHYFYIYDDDMGLDEPRGGEQIAILSDKIRTEFQNNHGSYRDEWAEKRLFRATIPVPLKAAERVAGCSISVQSKNEDRYEDYGFAGVIVHDRGGITSEAITEAEWRRIDGKPVQAVKQTSPKLTAPIKSAPQGGVSSTAPQPMAEATPTRVVTIKISAKDKTLKDRIQDMVNLAPSVSSAGMWFKLSGEVESRELKQEMLKAAGAALIYAKRGDAYRQRIRALIADVSAFEAQFFITCPSCVGSKTVDGNCSTCSGSGRCKNANCRGGRHLVRQIQGSHYEICRECKGTGQCTKCHGTGKTQTRCLRCQGNGKTVNLDSVASAYRDSVDGISEAFQ